MTSASVKTSVFVGTSLDGFIARSNGAFEFLSAGGDEEHGFTGCGLVQSEYEVTG